MEDSIDNPKIVQVRTSIEGFASTKITGEYHGPVNEDDLHRKFEHPVHGGRVEAFGDGHFVYCRHMV